MVDVSAATCSKPGEVVIALDNWSCQLQYSSLHNWYKRGKMLSQTMDIVDAFRARGFTIGFVDNIYTLQDCSKCNHKGCCAILARCAGSFAGASTSLEHQNMRCA